MYSKLLQDNTIVSTTLSYLADLTFATLTVLTCAIQLRFNAVSMQ